MDGPRCGYMYIRKTTACTDKDAAGPPVEQGGRGWQRVAEGVAEEGGRLDRGCEEGGETDQ